MGNVGSKNWVRDDCLILLFNTGTVSALIYTEYIMFNRFWDLVVLTLAMLQEMFNLSKLSETAYC